MTTDEKKLKEMAELLLSKATMLEYHCGKCKYPLFEKGGKVLCPNCGPLEVRREELEKARAGKETRVAPPREMAKASPVEAALQKKLEELLKRFEEEKDPQQIALLLDAIEKIKKAMG